MRTARRFANVPVWALLPALTMLWAGPARAASFYGVLSANGAPAANVGMQLVCAGQVVGQSVSDARGSYGFRVDRQGPCELRVEGAIAQVVLYPNPTRYDFELRRTPSPALVQR